MTREEHLAWCKKRALEYAAAGDLAPKQVDGTLVPPFA